MTDDIETVEAGHRRNVARIFSCGYPTVVPQGEPMEYLEWWQDDTGDELAERLEHATEWLDEDDPATDRAFDRAWSELSQHAEQVVSQTIEALKRGGTVDDLCELIDAAARAGKAATAAFSDPDAASLFLAKIAELALAQIGNEKARPGVTESGEKNIDLNPVRLGVEAPNR